MLPHSINILLTSPIAINKTYILTFFQNNERRRVRL